MEQRAFGANSKGDAALLYTFTNKNGMMIGVTDLGATLHAVLVPDRDGNLCDVVLGYDTAEQYEEGATFFGATVGRSANRIGGASFVLNGRKYNLDKNDGENNLHSGLDFYSFRVWKVKEQAENSITFALHSPDGDQNYPGVLDIEVTYTLTDDNEIKIQYHGVPTKDTIINMTNHSYFNLSGHNSGPVLEQEVWIDADAYTRADATSIPTGEIVSVDGTPMDFRVPKTIGRDIEEDYEALNFGNGYDHNWVLKPRDGVGKVATLYSDKTGIEMEVYTDLPGVQMYTANFVEDECGKEDAIYQKRHAVCFETQYFPDAVNHENFVNPICRAGEAYDTTTVYKFIVKK